MGRTLSDAGRCDACQEGRNERMGKSLSDAGRSDACNEGQRMGRILSDAEKCTCNSCKKSGEKQSTQGGTSLFEARHGGQGKTTGRANDDVLGFAVNEGKPNTEIRTLNTLGWNKGPSMHAINPACACARKQHCPHHR